jgi:hypothetical protein
MNIWPTYDLPVRTEAGLSRRPGVLCFQMYILFPAFQSIYIETDVCVYVCMFQHNSGMPRAISTKLGTHMTTYIYKNIILYIIYIIYIYI